MKDQPFKVGDILQAGPKLTHELKTYHYAHPEWQLPLTVSSLEYISGERWMVKGAQGGRETQWYSHTMELWQPPNPANLLPDYEL